MGDYCNATFRGTGWPVCALSRGHEGDHESADFTWADGETSATPKLKVP